MALLRITLNLNKNVVAPDLADMQALTQENVEKTIRYLTKLKPGEETVRFRVLLDLAYYGSTSVSLAAGKERVHEDRRLIWRILKKGGKGSEGFKPFLECGLVAQFYDEDHIYPAEMYWPTPLGFALSLTAPKMNDHWGIVSTNMEDKLAEKKNHFVM